jgi:hypothetical protein
LRREAFQALIRVLGYCGFRDIARAAIFRVPADFVALASRRRFFSHGSAAENRRRDAGATSAFADKNFSGLSRIQHSEPGSEEETKCRMRFDGRLGVADNLLLR